MADFGTITVVRDQITGSQSFVASAGPRMLLYSESGRLALAVDVAPREIDYGGLAMDWAEAERSGERPLLLHRAVPLRTMSFTFTITDKYSLQTPQTDKISILKDIARVFERILVRFSPTEQGLWRITDLDISSQLRTASTNEVARATVSMTLTEASDPAPAIGPISKPSTPVTVKKVNRTHTVKKGESLWDIAKRYYGNGSLWPRIYDANRKSIKDPKKIYSGQKFTIP